MEIILKRKFRFQASIVDIAPNLAGPVLAFAQTIHMTASFVSPVVSGFIVTDSVKKFLSILVHVNLNLIFSH